MIKTYRIYFNRRDADRIWSIDEGTTDTETTWDHVFGFTEFSTQQNLAEKDRDNKPCCWIQVDGRLVDRSYGFRRIAFIEPAVTSLYEIECEVCKNLYPTISRKGPFLCRECKKGKPDADF